MSIIDSLMNNDAEDFRKQLYSALYDKVKEKLQDKKIEMASSLYDTSEESQEECEDCPKHE